ncbi:MAG TPA: hypothetical protein VMM78_11720 [Thermomicrobiales bacterium]|nr:hypothetical protein [Thermomicrobiales bacterium]
MARSPQDLPSQCLQPVCLVDDQQLDMSWLGQPVAFLVGMERVLGQATTSR